MCRPPNKTPPSTTKTFYVRIITMDDKGRVGGAPSLSVRVGGTGALTR